MWRSEQMRNLDKLGFVKQINAYPSFQLVHHYRSTKPYAAAAQPARERCGSGCRGLLPRKAEIQAILCNALLCRGRFTLLVMSRGKYKKFKQLWLEGKPSST